MTPAVFFDKDGTLVDTANACDRTTLTLEAGIGPCLRTLYCAGYKLFLISDQVGTAAGYFDPEDLTDVLRAIEIATGTEFSGFYFCPHQPFRSPARKTAGCGCRKPAPGMVFKAAHEHDLDLGQSWFVGDILNDVEAGNRAGCRTILIDNGNQSEWLTNRMRQPDYIVGNLFEAALTILTADGDEVGTSPDRPSSPLSTYEGI